MPRGYRGVILAAVGWLILTGAQQPTEQAKSDTGTGPRNEASTPPTEAPYRAYPKRYSDACYNAQNHDTADLCAQWRAAIAAEKAAGEARLATIAAIIGTVLSLATVVGLIITIWQTSGALAEARRGNRLNLLFERRTRREARKALVDQERALAAAERQVMLAEDTAKRQLRAYITVINIDITAVPNEPAKIGATVQFRNDGNTPAKELSARLFISILPGTRNECPLLEHHVKGGDSKLPLGSGDSRGITHATEILQGFTSDVIFGGDFTIFAYGICTYLDVFDDPHETRFCAYRSPETRKSPIPVVMAKSGNSLT